MMSLKPLVFNSSRGDDEMTAENIDLISSLVDKFGIPLVIAFVLFKIVVRLYNELKTSQEQTTNELKQQIKEIKAESREEKKIFNRTISEFSRAIDEFANVNSEISGIKSELQEIKDDVKEIKREK